MAWMARLSHWRPPRPLPCLSACHLAGCAHVPRHLPRTTAEHKGSAWLLRPPAAYRQLAMQGRQRQRGSVRRTPALPVLRTPCQASQ